MKAHARMKALSRVLVVVTAFLMPENRPFLCTSCIQCVKRHGACFFESTQFDVLKTSALSLTPAIIFGGVAGKT